MIVCFACGHAFFTWVALTELCLLTNKTNRQTKQTNNKKTNLMTSNLTSIESKDELLLNKQTNTSKQTNKQRKKQTRHEESNTHEADSSNQRGHFPLFVCLFCLLVQMIIPSDLAHSV